MNKVLITLAIVAGIMILLLSSYVSTYNYGNRQEKRIVAVHKNLENVLGQYSTKIEEIVQVPAMYRDDLKDVVKTALTSRYGQEGSKSVFQFLKEQNPHVNSAIYSKIQNIIDGGRDNFTNQQTIFLDVKRQYETALGSLWTGTLLNMQGYPKIDLKEYDITTNEYASDSFKSGNSKPIKLR